MTANQINPHVLYKLTQAERHMIRWRNTNRRRCWKWARIFRIWAYRRDQALRHNPNLG